jgi:hypothetical protein
VSYNRKKLFVITDEGIQMDFVHVKYPKGSRGTKMKHLYLDKENFKKRKGAIVQINNPQDSLCLPPANVVARFFPKCPTIQTPSGIHSGNG